ncbi:extensin-like protein [Actinidia rufa]|uniref:Extensin-like protein n=1 Tax=Actinidia rufa TaxID=165716 RepID=A0A7J0FTB2_9ERIC|nr:extensin-like protein [Actinidia rufa]
MGSNSKSINASLAALFLFVGRHHISQSQSLCTPKATCPRDTLKLGPCVELNGGLMLNVIMGTPSKTPCCSLMKGIAHLEASVCLCTAIKASIMWIHLNFPLSLSLLLNV